MESSRRPSFAEASDGLASIVDIEAGFSGNHHLNNHARHQRLVSRPLCYSLGRSFSFAASAVSPRSGRFYDSRFEDHQPHFLDACFLCKRPLGDNKDIYMYRGDTPFCSEECRQSQIDMDENREKRRSMSSSMKSLRNKDARGSTSPNKTSPGDYRFRTSTVAAA